MNALPEHSSDIRRAPPEMVGDEPVPRSRSRAPLVLALAGGALALLTCAGCLVLVLVVGLFSARSSTTVSEGGPAVTAREAYRHTVVPGAGLSIELPAGVERTDAVADEYSGSWWYEPTDGDGPRVFINALRFDDWGPEITDGYLRQVIEDVETSSGSHDLELGTIEAVDIDGYQGRRADYGVTAADGVREHAVALLIGRETDDVLIVVYGDERLRPRVEAAAERIMRSLTISPTPDSYQVQGL